MEKKKHSGFGAASFIMSAAAAVLFFVSFGVTAYGAYISWSMTKASEWILITVVIAWILSVLASFVGIILGIIGLFAKNKRRVFSFVGVAVSTFVLIFFVFVVIFARINYII